MRHKTYNFSSSERMTGVSECGVCVCVCMCHECICLQGVYCGLMGISAYSLTSSSTIVTMLGNDK